MFLNRSSKFSKKMALVSMAVLPLCSFISIKSVNVSAEPSKITLDKLKKSGLVVKIKEKSDELSEILKSIYMYELGAKGDVAPKVGGVTPVGDDVEPGKGDVIEWKKFTVDQLANYLRCVFVRKCAVELKEYINSLHTLLSCEISDIFEEEKFKEIQKCLPDIESVLEDVFELTEYNFSGMRFYFCNIKVKEVFNKLFEIFVYQNSETIVQKALDYITDLNSDEGTVEMENNLQKFSNN